jgi:hypothetical protein
MRSFLFAVSVPASQKKPDFGTPKMENALFMEQKKSTYVAFLAIPRATRVFDMALCQKKLCHDHGQA